MHGKAVEEHVTPVLFISKLPGSTCMLLYFCLVAMEPNALKLNNMHL